MIKRGERLCDNANVWFEYKPFNDEEWFPKRSLFRNRTVGISFRMSQSFKKGTHWQTIKRVFWKTYKYDIDKIPEFERLRVTYTNEDNIL